MNKPVLYLTVGLPASGKSTYTRQLSALRYSADAVRGELFGNEGIQYSDDYLRNLGYDTDSMSDHEKRKTCHHLVWNEVYRRMENSLNQGEDCIADGTFISPENRRIVISRFQPCAVIRWLYFRTPADICIERDSKRSRSVGEPIIRQYEKNLIPPELSEGFQSIDTIDENGQRISRAEQTGNSVK